MAHPLEGRYEVDVATGCWIWTAATGGRGYPRVRWEGRTEGAHRVSFFLANGYLPTLVRHDCDRPLCVNPEHLRAGTPAENSRDMAERGRSTYGERNPRAKLTSAQAVAIRAHPDPNNSAVAREFEVSRETVRRIRAGLNWTRVGGTA